MGNKNFQPKQHVFVFVRLSPSSLSSSIFFVSTFFQFSVYFHNHNYFRNEKLAENCLEMSMERSSSSNGLFVGFFSSFLRISIFLFSLS